MMIGLAILVGVAGMVTSMYAGTWQVVEKSMGGDYLLMPQSKLLGGGNIGAGPQLAQAVRETPGISAVTALRLATTKADGVDLQVVGLDPLTYPQVAGLQFSAGDEAQAYAALAAGRSMVVTGLFAAQNNLSIGQDVTLDTPHGPQTYRVVGVGVDHLNAKLATGYISHANLEQDFGVTTDLMIMADQSKDADPAGVYAALRELAADYPAFSLFSTAELRQEQKQEFAAKANMLYVLLAFLAVPSLIALVNTLAINVLERTREIGMLRAVGATRRQVRRLILAESLLLAATGTAFGLVLGVWLGYILVDAMNVGGYTIPYHFPVAGLLVTVAVGLLTGVAGALLPARQAANLDIVAALHYE